MRQEEKDYSELLECHQKLQRQHRNVEQKQKGLIKRNKKLCSEVATLKLRQQACSQRDEEMDGFLRKESRSHQEKDEKDDLLDVISMRLAGAEKRLGLLALENQFKDTTNKSNKSGDDSQISSLKMHLHELASQHQHDTLRLNLQKEKLRQILKLHNEYKTRHVALKKELHFCEAERNQVEEYKEEVVELREQNHFLEQQVTKLCCDGGNDEEEMERLRDALSQKESAYELLLVEIIKLQRENEHLHLRLSQANHKAKDIKSCYRKLEQLALEEAKLPESVDSSYAADS